MDINLTRLAVAGSVSHGIAIVCTVFRLVYRVWTHRIWWEDAWAAISLISDVVCLACIWIPYTDLPSWVLAVALTSVLCSHECHFLHHQNCQPFRPQGPHMDHPSYCGIICVHMSEPVAISQLITDVIADSSLAAAPLQLWKNVGLSRSRKILVLSSFGASIIITAITIPHAIILFKPVTETTLIFAHVKAAVSLIICNILVIVTFAYRVLSKETCDLDQSFTSPGLFSSVILTQFPISTYTRTSFYGQEGTTSKQITTGQSKSKPDDASIVSAEEGTNIEGWLET